METLPARPFVILKAKRETLLLAVSAVAVTFALAHVVHTRSPEQAPASTAVPQPQHVWAGNLASAEQPPSEPVPEKLTSSSLVVAKPARTKLASLGATPVQITRHECEGEECQSGLMAEKPLAISPSSHAASRRRDVQTASLVSKLNPMRYLPRSVRRSFDETGSAISDWFKSF